MEELELKHRPAFRKNCPHPTLSEKLIKPIIPEKLNSLLQKYQLTERR